MTDAALRILIGDDPREAEAYDVLKWSLVRRTTRPLKIGPISLKRLQHFGLYTRPVERRNGRLFDPISDAPMSTEFAISRFFVPWLVNGALGLRQKIAARDGWVLFMDCDMLALADVAGLFRLTDDRYAVMCVQHQQQVGPNDLKMDDQAQLPYARKNWSSLVLWNLAHPAHEVLTLALLNTLPGRDLHRFCWLQDAEIGALPEAWNWLDGHSAPHAAPAIVHMTRGGPWLPNWKNVAYAGKWLSERDIMRAYHPRITAQT